jgi:hypothetical protein
MSFAINPSLTHIDIPDGNILEIYRSKGQIQLSAARFRGHPCEAVICIATVDKTVTARVALLETVMNSIFVYTSDFAAEQSADYPKVLAEAQEFTASFGFTMEKVNLDFSPAMREVIIKGIRVMRPPPKKTKLRSLNRVDYAEQHAPEPSASPPGAVAEKSAEHTADPEEIRSLKAELVAGKALLEKITLEKETAVVSASREIATLKSTAGKLTKEIETLRGEQLTKASQDHDKQLQQLDVALKNKDSAIKALQDEIFRFTVLIENSEKTKLQLEDQLSAEKRIAAAEISRLTGEVDSLHALLTTEKNAAAETKEALAFLEISWKESQHREEDLCRNIDIMQKQIDKLAAELDHLRQQEEREAALLLTIAALEKEIGEARATIQQLASAAPERSALDAEMRSLAAAKNDVEAEYIRMANEAMEKEAGMLETLYAADSEIIRLSRELEHQRQSAEAEKEILRKELLQMTSAPADTLPAAGTAKPIESGAVATSELAAIKTDLPEDITAKPEPASKPAARNFVTAVPSASATHAVPEVDPTEDEAPDEPIIVEDEITKGLVNEFGSFCGGSNHTATEFTVDPGISSIDYSDPAEVLAILCSSNSVQAMPDGGSVQRCKGYVVALKQTVEYRVYLVWLMPESGKVVICTPEQQPADAAECTQMILDAVAYFEIVGFMMEIEELGSTVRSYQQAMKKVPALRKK